MKRGSSNEEPLFDCVWQEALTYQGIDEPLRHCLVVLAGVSDIGEDLSERLLVVNLHEVTVLFEFFFIFIIGVDILAHVVVVSLLVYETLQGQAVGEGRLLVGPADGEGGDGHDESGQSQDVDDLLRLVDGGAEVAVAEPLFVHEVAERLCEEQGVGCGIDEREEVVVSWLCLAAFCPKTGAVEIGTDGQHHRGTSHHWLVEVGGGQLFFHLLGTGDDNTVELEVAHGLGACSFGEQTIQQFFADLSVGILSDGTTGKNCLHILSDLAAKLRNVFHMSIFSALFCSKSVSFWKTFRNFVAEKINLGC